MSYQHREVFAASPLALVAAEMRFTDSPRLRRQETTDMIAICLDDRFPISEMGGEANFEFGPEGPRQVSHSPRRILRSRDLSESLTISSTSVIYETTAYRQFEDLLGTVIAACDALSDAQVRPNLTRVGLRYIDEIRVPIRVEDVADWSEWIDPRLLQHATADFCGTVRSSQTNTQCDLGDGYGLTVQSGALPEGSVVVSPGLHREEPPIDEPFFVLDFDGYRTFEPGTPLQSSTVNEALAFVHEPCGAAFQSCITDRARRLFRGEDA